MMPYRADLHIHSVLSPCGDLDMSPTRILKEALKRNVDILGISDHNSTRHCRLMMELGKRAGIFVLPGVEINTKEEIHCLAFFENADICEEFQYFLDKHLPAIPNKPELFGQQLVVDEYEHILEEIEPLLISALEADIYRVSEEVYRLGGIFIPAHIDRPYNSILSQLGFIPDNLQFDALEISARIPILEFLRKNRDFEKYTLLTNSDAHYPDHVGRSTSMFKIETCSFREIQMALRRENHRKVAIR